MSRKKHKKNRIDNRRIIGGILIGVWILAFSIAVFYLLSSGKSGGEDAADTESASQEDNVTAKEQGTENPETEQEEKEDPQREENRTAAEEGAKTEITQILISQNAAETDKVTLGIDVSKFQGTIDWKAVGDAGIECPNIRICPILRLQFPAIAALMPCGSIQTMAALQASQGPWM